MLHDKLIEKIKFEISEIEKELSSYKLLIDLCKIKEPDLVEKTATASILHSFYTGIENILVAIAKDLDKNVPSDKNWHNKLLNQTCKNTNIRKAVLSENSKTLLVDYLGFRHFFRHSYSFYLDWELMSKIIIPINEVWQGIKNELLVFIEELKKH